MNKHVCPKKKLKINIPTNTHLPTAILLSLFPKFSIPLGFFGISKPQGFRLFLSRYKLKKKTVKNIESLKENEVNAKMWKIMNWREENKVWCEQ